VRRSVRGLSGRECSIDLRAPEQTAYQDSGQAIRLAEPVSGTTAVAANQRQIFRDTAQVNLATVQGRDCSCEWSEMCGSEQRRRPEMCIFRILPKNLSKDCCFAVGTIEDE